MTSKKETRTISTLVQNISQYLDDTGLFLKMACAVTKKLNEIKKNGLKIHPEKIYIDENTKIANNSFYFIKSPDKKRDERSLIYEWGCILYYCSTETLPEKENQILLLSFKNNPLLPNSIKHIIEKSCSTYKEDRYQSLEALYTDLKHCKEEWQKTGNIEPFFLGKKDTPKKLTPQTLKFKNKYTNSKELTTLLEKSMGISPTKSKKLTQILIEKTRGETYTVKKLLEKSLEEKKIYYKKGSKKWNWDHKKLETLPISSSLAKELYKQEKLPPKTKFLLEYASCMEEENVDIKELQKALPYSTEEIELFLWYAVNQKWILKKKDNTYTFSHPGLQKELYKNIHPGQLANYHLKICNIQIENKTKTKETYYTIASNIWKIEALIKKHPEKEKYKYPLLKAIVLAEKEPHKKQISKWIQSYIRIYKPELITNKLHLKKAQNEYVHKHITAAQKSIEKIQNPSAKEKILCQTLKEKLHSTKKSNLKTSTLTAKTEISKLREYLKKHKTLKKEHNVEIMTTYFNLVKAIHQNNISAIKKESLKIALPSNLTSLSKYSACLLLSAIYVSKKEFEYSVEIKKIKILLKKENFLSTPYLIINRLTHIENKQTRLYSLNKGIAYSKKEGEWKNLYIHLSIKWYLLLTERSTPKQIKTHLKAALKTLKKTPEEKEIKILQKSLKKTITEPHNPYTKYLQYWLKHTQDKNAIPKDPIPPSIIINSQSGLPLLHKCLAHIHNQKNWKSTSDKDKKEILKAIKALKENSKYLNYYLLAQATLNQLKEKPKEAQLFYESALFTTKRDKYIPMEILTQIHAIKFYKKTKKIKLSKHYEKRLKELKKKYI